MSQVKSRVSDIQVQAESHVTFFCEAKVQVIKTL